MTGRHDTRLEMVRFMEQQLIGPSGGENETLVGRERPTSRYLMGILFPQEQVAAAPTHNLGGADDLPDDEWTSSETEEETQNGRADEDPSLLSGKWEPSSAGISLYFSGPALEVAVRGGRYRGADTAGGRQWHREPLATEEHPELHLLEPPQIDGTVNTRAALMGAASLHVLWRRLPGGWLVTVSLINREHRGSDQRKADPEKCLYQVGLSCQAPGGRILPYPAFRVRSADPEEEELRMLYRHRLTYGVGHGCSASWTAGEDGVTSVQSAFLPRSEVRPMTQHVPGINSDVLGIRSVAFGQDRRSEILAGYRAMVDQYAAWIQALPKHHQDAPTGLHSAVQRLLNRLNVAVERMRSGITLLQNDDEVWQAFVLANRAMLMQMRHADSDLGRTRHTLKRAPARMPATYDDTSLDRYRWRPFQLAFMLLTLPSLCAENDPHRQTVDLIWFPTGGGKTEAYLLAAAHVMIMRRLRHGDAGAGTAVITRYTLRLLTAQQFRRATGLICALELLRRQEPEERLGTKSFSSGFWVGGDSTPNSFADAEKDLESVLTQTQVQNPFVLDSCPWCGTEILPARRSSQRAAYGVQASSSSFRMNCPNPVCTFHDHLPVQVVDDGLYLEPPSFLLGTVDKFAMVAWREKAGLFYGSDTCRAPDLIIQDELHLLAGPLGTTVGIYESALLQVIEMRGVLPKIIASTATIRRAGEQVRALYDRPVQLFPPSGLDASNSFFARENDDPAVPGRLYIGVMSPHQSMKTAFTQLGTVLVEGPVQVLQPDDPLTDSYSTLVAYFNSLKELGQGMKLAQDDIRSRLISVYNRAATTLYGEGQVAQLTGRVGGAQLTEVLASLSEGPQRPNHIAVLATTNMISVGVDVPRLGLMMVNGQPKGTSEYIQATSRVGREVTWPGTVVVLYSPAKARDRSHFESFPTYHAALYRHVEPTSITPFALPSRMRALHAALVILYRHGLPGRAGEKAAGLFDENSPEVADVCQRLLSWVERVDPRELEQTRSQLTDLRAAWHRHATAARAQNRPLNYSGRDKAIVALLRSFDAPPSHALWPTLTSMRAVDASLPVRVLRR